MTASMPAAMKIGGCFKNLSDPLTKLSHPSCEGLRFACWWIDIRQQNHHDQCEHAERPDRKVGDRVAGSKIEDEAADEWPGGSANVVCRREPPKPSASPSGGKARHVGRGDRRENGGSKAVYKTKCK